MKTAVEVLPHEPLSPKRPAYDPNNLHPLDAEARKYDDTSEGIDWDEIMATTQDDFEAGRFAFNSANYPDEEAAWAALEALIHRIVQEAIHGKRPYLHLMPRVHSDTPTEYRPILLKYSLCPGYLGRGSIPRMFSPSSSR